MSRISDKPACSGVQEGHVVAAFSVKGVNPLTGQVVELTVLANTVMDAKRQVEACGLRYVVASEVPQPEPPAR
ncbi:MAG: hypothetical protein IT437_07400 [Phycisphaerales bacterium]|nr:hypothetical protein [Phycisphaerales bacterium]